MWRKIYEGTLSCLKRIFVEPLTIFVSAAIIGVHYVRNAASAILDGAKWVSEKAEEANLKKLSKFAVVRAMFLFIGGLICCFLFPEDARGDLTWFEKMLITAQDCFGLVVGKCSDYATGWLSKITRHQECNTT